ncbi:MAG: DUF421 domain-containing protein [Arcicella sp.]|jgi:uncharacterized membrane protein YcaP (DUF421 family)|nr:DUF421 domain-containing protein [Arcicella sp.]
MDYLNIALKSIAVYAFIVAAIRLFGKKELAQLSVIDLVFILLISNAVQNAMVGDNTTLLGGLTAASGLFLTNFVLKKILFKHKGINKLIQGEPVMLIYKGKLRTKALNEVDISIPELEAAVRKQGVAQIDKVDLAVLEIDGSISVIAK